MPAASILSSKMVKCAVLSLKRDPRGGKRRGATRSGRAGALSLPQVGTPTITISASNAFGAGAVKGTCATRANTGDFVNICRAHSIPVTNLDRAWVKQVVLPFKPERIGVFFLNADSFIVVDRNGSRFASEKHFYQERGRQMIESPDDRRVVFFVFDERSRELYEGPIKGLGGPIPFKSMEDDCLLRAESVSELGDRISEKLQEVAPEMALGNDFAASLERL